MVSRCFLSWPDEASSHFFMPKPASQRFPVRAAVRKKRAESIRPLEPVEKPGKPGKREGRVCAGNPGRVSCAI